MGFPFLSSCHLYFNHIGKIKHSQKEETEAALGSGGAHIAVDINHGAETAAEAPSGPVRVCVALMVYPCPASVTLSANNMHSYATL